MKANNIEAKWIWHSQKNYKPYNQTVKAVKVFKLSEVKRAEVMITADSFYRLFINGQWVNDGPARSWPQHFQVDRIDVTNYLQNGENIIEVIARFDGVGSFRIVPTRAGLLVQLNAELKNGTSKRIVSDKTWDVAVDNRWVSNVPKMSAQRGPAELYDSLESPKPRFRKAAELDKANQGPVKGLQFRQTALLTKDPFPLKSFMAANLVKNSPSINFCVCLPKLVTPGLMEAQMHNHYPFAMATVIKVSKKCSLKIISETWRTDHFKVSIDGKTGKNGVFTLNPGTHILVAAVRCTFMHDKDVSLRLVDPPKMKMENPIDPGHENPWCCIPYDEYAFSMPDIVWTEWFENHPEQKQKRDKYLSQTDSMLREVKDKNSFKKLLGSRAKLISSEKMFVRDDFWRFKNREVLGNARENVQNPAGLIYDNPHLTAVKPDSNGDIELVYDLGEQNCGYWSFEAAAAEGTIFDIYGVEYINSKGEIQHTTEIRNGFRYIAKEGLNRFTSMIRRSARYIFITIRNQQSEVKFRSFKLIESTYPVDYTGSFTCSDETLNRIWDISARTLKLCMEDTFVDCPGYEQTLWTGDARNEALFAYYVFGGVDVAQNSLRLGAESLDRLPLVGCQVPSCWDTVIPAWSFLWNIAVWENYFYSGDLKFLKSMWKDMLKNLKRAERYINSDGLFSVNMWNLFDWADIDHDRDTVLHNSMFFVGAIDATLKCADVLKKKDKKPWLSELKTGLVKAINKTWDTGRRSYPDSIYNDGTASRSICRHTSFLSILYEIIPRKHYKDAYRNTMTPRSSMIPVGSPFALLYLYEAMEKLAGEEAIIKDIYNNYRPMLEDGATTTWEVFADSPVSPPGDFPSRSHCHAWSAAPAYFLNRIILGLKQTKTAAKEFELSPLLCGLENASGSIATIEGPVTVKWQVQGKQLEIKYSAPKGVKVNFRRNPSHKGLKVNIAAI